MMRYDTLQPICRCGAPGVAYVGSDGDGDGEGWVCAHHLHGEVEGKAVRMLSIRRSDGCAADRAGSCDWGTCPRAVA